MKFYGVDIHYDSFVVATMDKEGKSTLATIRLDNKVSYYKFLNNLTKEDSVAVEASTNSFWFHDQVKPLVSNCYVINPGRFKDIGGTNKKTDKIDATKIAKKLRYKVLDGADEVEFPIVHVPSKEIREIRSLFTTYELLTSDKVRVKNRIYSLFIMTVGRDISKSVNLYQKTLREKLLNLIESVSMKIQVKVLYEELDYLEKQVWEIKEAILKAGSIYEDQIDKLVGIKGVSVFTAIAIIADISDIKRFSNAKKLSSYLGSAPTIESSNTTEKIKSVNKQSRKLALKMLLQGMQHICRMDGYLKDCYQRMKKGKKAGKVRIAIARKIFVGIYQMLTKGTNFYWHDEIGHDRKMKEYKKFLEKMKKSA